MTAKQMYPATCIHCGKAVFYIIGPLDSLEIPLTKTVLLDGTEPKEGDTINCCPHCKNQGGGFFPPEELFMCSFLAKFQKNKGWVLPRNEVINSRSFIEAIDTGLAKEFGDPIGSSYMSLIMLTPKGRLYLKKQGINP